MGLRPHSRLVGSVLVNQCALADTWAVCSFYTVTSKARVTSLSEYICSLEWTCRGKAVFLFSSAADPAPSPHPGGGRERLSQYLHQPSVLLLSFLYLSVEKVKKDPQSIQFLFFLLMSKAELRMLRNLGFLFLWVVCSESLPTCLSL